MSPKSSRRTLLKGLAISVPAVWAPPVVESVILPAHAQTSIIPGSLSSCSAPAGCYYAPNNSLYFQWPGGTGPHTVGTSVDSCTSQALDTLDLLVAESQAEALAIAESALGAGVSVLPAATTPALAGDCDFYVAF